MDTPFVEKAIPMVSVDEKTGKYVLTNQALNFFRAINGPIAVVSVAGLYRTGKSYLLNRVLLNRSNGFGVGPTVNPCTKGLWCWGTPIKGTSTDGEPVNIVVIDTEGIGALDQDQTHDTKIFTLAILASSCFIYNSVGSIDQTAIQNLSLVVNLTKHIQLKASEDEGDEGVDPDEISMYFPTFYWVVRDFSLQLQDPEGNPISSKEYLEKALAPQNGFSDDVEEKNRIRRLLTAFFKDRDCYTMIRPLVDEMKLQNLDKMDYDELRPEFVQQAMTFRKRIINSVKAKTLQNQKLNGTLYCSMINSYVQAINEGAVPNIENAWNYMCEEQCRRAMDECYEIFIRGIQDGLRDLPKPEEEFNRCVSEAQDKALDAYREKALGVQAAAGLNELKHRIRSQIAEIRDENIKQSHKQVREYIVKQAAMITKKLNNQQYTTYSEYEKEIVALGQKFNNQGPKLHNYKFTYLEAVRKLSAQGAEFLFKKFTKEQEKVTELFREKERNMSGDITKLKGQYDQLRKKYNQLVTVSDQKVYELSNKQETLRKQLEITIKSKEDDYARMQQDIDMKNSDHRAKFIALEEKFNDVSSKFEDKNKQFSMEMQGWVKEKAVFEQQIKHQLLQIQDLQKKEKSLDAALNLKQNNMSKEVRQISMRLQTEKESLKLKLNDQTEKMSEMSEQLNNLKEELGEKTDKFEKKEKKYKEDLTNTKKEMEKLKKDFEQERKQLNDGLRNNQDTTKAEISSIELKLKDSERIIKELNEKTRINGNEFDKQKSLLEQQVMFAKQECESLKLKADQMKQDHKQELKNFVESNKNENEEGFNKRIMDLKATHNKEIDDLYAAFETDKQTIARESNNTKVKLEELEKKFNTMKCQKEACEAQLRSELSDLKIQYDKLNCDRNNIEATLKSQIGERQSYFEGQLRRVEQQFQEYKDNSLEQYQKIETETHMRLEQFRNQSQLELENTQKRLSLERERNEKKVRDLIQEHDRILEEEREVNENEKQQLFEKLINTEELFRSNVNQYQHTTDLLNKQVAQLTQTNRELKETLQKREQEYNAKELLIMTTSKSQREKLEVKIDELVRQLNQKERESMNLKHEKDQLTSTLEKKESKLTEVETELAKSQQRYKLETERLMIKNKQVETEMMEKTSSLSKEIALLEQKISFEVNRGKELEVNLASITKTSEEQYNKIKSEKEDEIKAISAKLTNEKVSISEKYQSLKNSSKENDNSQKKIINDLATKVALQEEKLSNLENRLGESERTRENEVTTLKRQNKEIRENALQKEKDLQDTARTLNQKIEKLEVDKNDLIINFQKEKVLSEQRIVNSNKIREDHKRQSDEKIKTLQMQLAKEQSSRLQDKSSFDSNYIQVVSSTEARFKQRITDLQENLSRARHDHDALLKEKENQFKEYSQKLEYEKNLRDINITNLRRKNEELLENQRKKTEELEKLKKDKTEKETENLRKEQVEKDALKKRVQQLENKNKDAYQKAMTNNFEFEKERSKWNFEKDNLNDKITEMKEHYEKVKKESEKLKVENEKLKGDRKNTKNYTNYLSNLKTHIEPPKIQKTVSIEDNNKENANYQ